MEPSLSEPPRPGEAIDPGRTYFRLFLRFEAGHEHYGPLEHSLGIGSAIRHPQGVTCDVYLLR